MLEGGERGCVDSRCRCRPQEAADAVTLRERQLRGASWCAGSPAEPSAGRALAARPRAAVHCNSPPSTWIGAHLWRLRPLRSRLRWSSRLGALIRCVLLPGTRRFSSIVQHCGSSCFAFRFGGVMQSSACPLEALEEARLMGCTRLAYPAIVRA